MLNSLSPPKTCLQGCIFQQETIKEFNSTAKMCPPNLDCSCPQQFLENLNEQSLVLELRQKKIWGSQLIGKSEIPWKVIIGSQNMELKKWLNMDLVSGSDCKEGMFKTPEVEVEIKVRVALVAEMEKQNKKRLNNWNECGCKNGHDHQVWCNTEDCDVFALGAALEAF